MAVYLVPARHASRLFLCSRERLLTNTAEHCEQGQTALSSKIPKKRQTFRLIAQADHSVTRGLIRCCCILYSQTPQCAPWMCWPGEKRKVRMNYASQRLPLERKAARQWLKGNHGCLLPWELGLTTAPGCVAFCCCLLAKVNSMQRL